MQGQRTGIESLPDTLELDNAPGSSVEQDAFWNNMLVDPIETHSISSYVRPSNSSMSYVNVASQEGLNLNLWNSGGSSSSAQSNSHNGHDEIKMGHIWSSSPAISVGENRTEEGRCEADNMLSLGNMNLNYNTVDVPQSSVHNNSGKAHMSDQAKETGLCLPCDPVLFQPEDVPSSSGSSSMFESSSGNAGFYLEETDRRSIGSLNGRRLSCKRKNVELLPGQCSSSGSAPFLHRGETNTAHAPASNPHICHSSGYRLGLSSPVEQHNTGVCCVSRDVTSDCRLPINASGSAESSHRNFRMRINPTCHRGMTSSNIWVPGSSSGESNVWGSSQQYSPVVPFNHSVDAMPIIASTISYPQPPIPVIPNLPENVQCLPWNGSSRLTLGSSSSSSIPAGENSFVLGGMMMNSVSEHTLHVPAVEVRPPVNRRVPNLASDRIILGGNSDTPRQGPLNSSSGFHPSLGTAWVPQHNVISRHHQRVSNVARASIFPSSGSEFDGQSSDFALHQPRRSSSPVIARPGVSHGNQHQNALRSGAAVDRLNGGTLLPPLSIRTLAGRRRILSEHIRNALSIMRRGDNLRFEDAILFDHAVFLGAADLHDRHRDMRLDVDNMSYEELLALEERIGNVSTGLSEERIMKSLKQHKYSSRMGKASQEVEPCCVCQEEYAEGEELGRLDCGHDFHTACIKQWLMQKNLCPICKDTALHA